MIVRFRRHDERDSITTIRTKQQSPRTLSSRTISMFRNSTAQEPLAQVQHRSQTIYQYTFSPHRENPVENGSSTIPDVSTMNLAAMKAIALTRDVAADDGLVAEELTWIPR